MLDSKMIAKLSLFSFGLFEKTSNFFHALLSGFWLGVMGNKSLDKADEIHFEKTKLYNQTEYNESGLYEWEKGMIEKYFSKSKSLLLIGAGAGRETLALLKMDYLVDSYECNTKLIAVGNEILRRNNYKSYIKYLERNTIPKLSERYDGIIIGWGVYTHMRGRKSRLSFLLDLNKLLKPRAPIMISFLTREKNSKRDYIIYYLSGIIRFLSFRLRTEIGDRLIYGNLFAHFFSKNEIYKELEQANYNVKEYYDVDYGCAIATSKEE